MEGQIKPGWDPENRKAWNCRWYTPWDGEEEHRVKEGQRAGGSGGSLALGAQTRAGQWPGLSGDGGSVQVKSEAQGAPMGRVRVGPVRGAQK